MICRKFALVLLVAGFALTVKAQSIAVGGSGSPVIGIFDSATAKQLWSYTMPEGSECNSIDVAANGNVLLSYRAGVRLVDKSGKTLWDYPVAKGQEAQTARLIDGSKRVLVGICGSPALMVELDAQSGKELRQTKFDTGIAEPHGQFRQAIKSSRGGYLIPLMGAAKVVEIDTTGRQIAQWDVPSSPFSIKELCCNRLMVSSKEGVIELDRTTGHSDTLCWGKLGEEKLYFATEAKRIDDGVTVVSNWQGYAPKGEQASQIVWLDRHGKAYKTFSVPEVIKHVSCFSIIE